MAMRVRLIEKEQTYTTEQFMALSLNPGKRYELVRGVIKEMSQPGGEHMVVTDNLYFALSTFVRNKQLGRVLPPGGYELKIPGEDKDTVRSPDLTFVPSSLTDQIGTGALTFPPALAVEVYSRNDRPGELRKKLEDYHLAGWNLVWVIYPPNSAPKIKAGKVEIYRLQESLEPLELKNLSDELEGEDTLQGFKLPVKALFE